MKFQISFKSKAKEASIYSWTLQNLPKLRNMEVI